jgi:hypothetical protein
MPWVAIGKIFGAAAVFVSSYLFSAFMNAAVMTQPSLDRGPSLGTTTVVIVQPSEADESASDHVKEPSSRRPAPAASHDPILPL